MVPQTFDYNMPLTAPAQQVSPFTAPPPLTFPQASQFMYPPVQEEFPMPYFQEAVPQQMPPPPALPPPLLQQPPSTFIYQEHHGNMCFPSFELLFLFMCTKGPPEACALYLCLPNPVEGIICPGTGLNRQLLAAVWGLGTESRSPVLLTFVPSLLPSMHSS